MAKVTGGIYIPHLKNEVIKPTLEYLGLGGVRAINLVTGTFLAEGYASGYTYLKQIKGPAVGPEQMEPATYNDIWKNFLSGSKRANLAIALKQLAGDWNTDANGIPLPSVMTGNLFLAVGMCRVHYLRVPTAIPEATDSVALADYHKKHYNTSAGKADQVFDIKKATNHLTSNAQAKSVGLCGRYVHNALEAGGITTTRLNSAYMYNDSLSSMGFEAISKGTTLAEANKQAFKDGDVVVFNKSSAHPHGHIEMRANNGWVSDFKQKNFCPYTDMLPWTLWRFKQSENVDRFQQAIDA